MIKMALSSGQQKALLAAAVVVIVAGVGWSIAGAFRGGATSKEPDMSMPVLCSACGYHAPVMLAELKRNGQPALAPMFGPGYVCPSCGKTTLYANPTVCEKCKSLFLMSPGPSGAAVEKCPKCGWIR
jgi:hypothetical protein